MQKNGLGCNFLMVHNIFFFILVQQKHILDTAHGNCTC